MDCLKTRTMCALIFIRKRTASPKPHLLRLSPVLRANSHAVSAIFHSIRRGGLLILFGATSNQVNAADSAAALNFKKNVEPILSKYCYDCHGNGIEKGGVSFDEYTKPDELI